MPRLLPQLVGHLWTVPSHQELRGPATGRLWVRRVARVGLEGVSRESHLSVKRSLHCHRRSCKGRRDGRCGYVRTGTSSFSMEIEIEYIPLRVRQIKHGTFPRVFNIRYLNLQRRLYKLLGMGVFSQPITSLIAWSSPRGYNFKQPRQICPKPSLPAQAPIPMD